MSTLYQPYERLADHDSVQGLERVWHDLFTKEMCHSWDGARRNGHVPYADFDRAYDILADSFARPGLYVWGAWTGEAARPQYVGISGELLERFERRYYLRATGRNATTVARKEVGMARAWSDQLSAVASDSYILRPADPSKYRDQGIRVPSDEGKLRRVVRAERYAKIGLERLWYYLIPSPHAQLHELEHRLVHVANAQLFSHHRRGDEHALPLLNAFPRTRNRVISNPLIADELRDGFALWLDGRA